MFHRTSQAGSLAGAAEAGQARELRVIQRLRVFVVALTAMLSVAFAPMAAASTSTPAESTVNVDEIVARVAAADDFDALMKGLTPEEREVAIWALTPARSEVTSEIGPLTNWTWSHTRTWESYANIDLYSVGMRVGWRVSPNPDGWLDDRWVETHAIGWRFGGWQRWNEGVYSSYIAMVSQAHMIFGAGGVDINNTYPCVKIFGYNGSATGSSSCST